MRKRLKERTEGDTELKGGDCDLTDIKESN